VALDIQTPGTPGWWMNRLAMKLQRENRRYAVLDAYANGRPPLAWGSEDVRKNFYRFQKMSKTTFADVIVEAPCMRLGLRSVTTGADSNANGDPVAWNLLNANGIPALFADGARLAKRFGVSYLATAMPDVEGGNSIITIEDPRQMTVETHPFRTTEPVAAFKLYYDPSSQLDIAILWLPGEKWVATRPRPLAIGRQYRSGAGHLLGRPEPVPVRFAASSFDLAPMRDPESETEAQAAAEPIPGGLYSERYDDQEIPVDVLGNRDLVGEFELHTDLLDRINHIILQRVVIATLQAFRQRALKQSAQPGVNPLPKYDKEGKEIDYSDILESGPDAVWLLPPGADLWESAQTELTGILSAVKDDVLHLSAVTFTPMSMFTPDAATQTAEGAQLSREGLVFKVEDFQRRAQLPLARTIARAFRYMGDETRGDASQIAVQWMPADRPSLAEMGSAASQVMGTLTWEQTQEIVWQQTPAQIAVAKAQRAEDMVLAQQQAALEAAQKAQAAPSRPQEPAAGPRPSPSAQPGSPGRGEPRGNA
jgi:hypothetical protein